MHNEAVALRNGSFCIECERVQIFSREVRPEIGAVSPNRAVLHQAIAQEDLLAGGNLGVGEKNRAIRIDHALGNRWRSGIGQLREPSEHAKAKHDRNNR